MDLEPITDLTLILNQISNIYLTECKIVIIMSNGDIYQLDTATGDIDEI
eukprot:CAMPEP_0116954054 /NCGR_PEP_ID=MMETSP0467-20121206/41682_1 /TAXON_ID=283647 /ORGANISM="Mesodinium pulex, Strain SPMC105" /LENGTH=48 /DNA_ID= /DNA_START= /DNA_END= /DNA_ORIENTATION=